jgi:hypothetical protein
MSEGNGHTNGHGTLTRDDFRRAAERRNLRAEPAEVDLWGDGHPRKVWVRVMTAGESIDYHQRNFAGLGEGQTLDGPAQKRALADLIACTACGDDRELLFTADDIGWILDLPDSAAGVLANKARHVNRLTAQSRGELEKNSDPAAASTPSPESAAS